MSELASCIYEGTVVHKRLHPRQHGFSYRVFALCLDVDEIDEATRKLRFFSRRQRNIVSFWDEDLGENGVRPVGEKARSVLAASGQAEYGERIDVGLLLGCIRSTRCEGDLHVVTGVLRGQLDGGAAAQHDEIGERNLLAAGL